MSDEPWIDRPPTKDRLGRTALAFSLIPLVMFGGCAIGHNLVGREGRDLLADATLLSGLLAPIGLILGIVAYRRAKSDSALVAIIVGSVMSVVDALLAFASTIEFQRGRAFRRRGRARLPEPALTSHWSFEDGFDLDVDEALRSPLAEAWRAMAATEAASVASFSSYSNQLLAIGAPSELIEDAHRDALDEIRHARLCYAVARAIDGRAMGAGAFPAAALPLDRTPTLESLAIECARESCVLEGASAIAARRLSERPELLPGLRSVLSAIAADEARHARHGWDGLEWLWPLLSKRSRSAVISAVRALATAVPKSLIDHDALESYGVAGPTLWENAVRESVDATLQRLGQPIRNAASALQSAETRCCEPERRASSEGGGRASA